MVLTTENRRTLAERVQQKVAGRGISRRDVDDAVDRVARALEHREAESHAPGCGCAAHQAPSVVVVLSATSMPDLASRSRDALAREGVTAADIGAASAGRHTVVTLRVAPDQSDSVRRAAQSIGAAISVQPSEVVA